MLFRHKSSQIEGKTWSQQSIEDCAGLDNLKGHNFASPYLFLFLGSTESEWVILRAEKRQQCAHGW